MRRRCQAVRNVRGGHTPYERKKKKKTRHLPQMKLKYQMKLIIFRLYMNFDELIFFVQ